MERIINKWLLLVSTIITLIGAISYYFNSAISNLINRTFQPENTEQLSSISSSISIFFFLLGISLIILQLIAFSYLIHSKISVIDDIKDYIYKHKIVHSHRFFKELESEIHKKISNNEVYDMTIICYGTSGFGNLIRELDEKYLFIKANILVCSPKSDFILYKERDISLIKDTLNICEKNKRRITITESLIPPTIRACILYDKDEKPIWTSIQTYYFEDKEIYNSFNYKNFYAVVSDTDNISSLNEMETIIKSEFERLTKFSLKYSMKRGGINDELIQEVLKMKITKEEYNNIINCQCQNNLIKQVETIQKRHNKKWLKWLTLNKQLPPESKDII